MRRSRAPLLRGPYGRCDAAPTLCSTPKAGHRNANPSDAFSGPDLPIGKIDMIKVVPPPSEAEEYRNTAEILRDLAAQTRFGKTRNELFNCADNLDQLALLAEHQPEATVQIVRAT